jgi:transposase
MKLTSVLTDVAGVSARAILEALIAGERDRDRLADLAVGKARTKLPALVEALDGDFTDHHAFMVRHYLDEADRFKTTGAAFNARIAVLLSEQERDLELVDTIPGLGHIAAETVLAETGGNMDQFPHRSSPRLLDRYLPGAERVGRVGKSGRIRAGNRNLKRLLGVAALAAIRNKETYLEAFFRRIAARRGGKRALIAVMHKIAIAIWYLHSRVPYRELGADYFTKRDPARAMRRMTKEANSLGLTVRFEPITTV